MKKIFIFLTIFTLFTTLTANTAFAQTVTSSPTPTYTNKLLQAAQNQQTRMQNIIAKANGYISERMTSINNMISYINNSKEASSPQAQADLADLNSTISGLTNLKSQIDAFNDPTNIKNGLLPLVQQIFTTYRVYAIELPKDHLALHIAFLNTLNTNFTTAEQNMTQDITFAQGQSKDVTTIQADNTKYSNDVAKYNEDVQTAQSALNAIIPADYQKGVNAFTGMKADLKTTHADIQTIHADFTQFEKDFKTLFNL